MTAIPFRKYHGLGNDYLVIDPTVAPLDLTPERIRFLCDRHVGVGSDGILYGPTIDVSGRHRVRIFNPDGSEAEKSGNGLRIFARYLHDAGHVLTKTFDIQTLGGPVTAEIQDATGETIKIGMGKVTFQSEAIPTAGPDRQVIGESLRIDGTSYEVTCLSIGNPHCVIPLGDISEALTRRLGPLVECHPLFPNRTNVQFVRVTDRHRLEVQIWERGAGYTLASGSSACAAAAATQKLGRIDSPVTVRMPGGELRIDLEEEGHVSLTGPVEYVFEGEIALLS